MTPWTAICQASVSNTNSRSLLKLRSIKLVIPSNHLILCLPLLLPSIFPASGSLPMSQFFTSCGQSFGASASASVLPMNIQDLFPLGMTGFISSQIFPRIRVFSSQPALHIRWPKYWNFSISPSNEYSGLISFRIDWFDHLAVQGTLKSLLQHHSSKASVLWCSAFFIMVQLSHPYMITGKTIALTIWTFAGKVMSAF